MPRTQFPPRECANTLCSNVFAPTSKNRNKVYCSRKCSPNPSHEGMAHTPESKARISKSKKGQNAGHPFWGNREATNTARRKRAEQQILARPVLVCANPDCDNTFTRRPPKQFCSISCGQKVKSTLGARSRGRTPPEGAGRCKWYDFPSVINDRSVRVQGSWELRVANCLEAEGLPWRANHGRDRFPYVDINDVERTYCPDFWQDGSYVEVKGYADPATQHKLVAIQASGVPLRILYWEDIKALETKLFGKPLAGANGTTAMIMALTHG